MFYSYKNTRLTINGAEFFVNKATISEQASLEPQYLEGERNSFRYASNDNVNGVLQFSYYLTGADPLKASFSDEETPIIVDFAGLYFNKGYLRSYGISIAPNIPAIVDAEIVFFDSLSGRFSPTGLQNHNCNYLTLNNATLSQSSSAEDLTNVLNGKFRLFNEIESAYVMQDEPVDSMSNFEPTRVVFGPKELSLDLECDSLTGLIPIQGSPANIRIALNNPAEPGNFETISISGSLFSRVFNVEQGDLLKSTISIKQHNLAEPPTITSFVPNNGTLGTEITIYGTNFKNVIDVFVGPDKIDKFKVLDPQTIKFNVPYNVDSGPVRVYTYEASVSSTSSLVITYPPISVTNITPGRAEYTNSILIEGQNFTKANKVRIYDREVAFKLISPELIQAFIPERTANGLITVANEIREKTGISNDYFYGPPYLDGFTPHTGIAGTSITITGANFSGLTDVSFNNISASYTINTTGQITAIVPAGDTKGQVAISNSGNYIVFSNYDFTPSVLISGVSPYVAKTNDVLSISGVNFLSNYLNQFSPNTYSVVIGGVQTGFYLSSSTLLTGRVPYLANSGTVLINQIDGVNVYNSTGNYYKVPNPPIVTQVTPTGFYSGDLMYLTLGGEYVQSITKIFLSGVRSGTASGKSITVYDTNSGSAPAETNSFRFLNTVPSYDLLGYRTNASHNLSTGQSYNRNSFLTGVSTGLYDLYVVSQGGTGFYSYTGTVGSGILISAPPNLSRVDNTIVTLSSYEPGNSGQFTGYYSGYYTPYRVTDGITGANTQNKKFCSTSGQITPYLHLDLGTKVKLQYIDVYTRSGANLYTTSGGFTQFLQVNLYNSGQVIQSGTMLIAEGDKGRTGYTQTYITGYPHSWRYEVDALRFIGHKQSASVEQSTKFQMAEIEVYGIYR